MFRLSELSRQARCLVMDHPGYLRDASPVSTVDTLFDSRFYLLGVRLCSLADLFLSV